MSGLIDGMLLMGEKAWNSAVDVSSERIGEEGGRELYTREEGRCGGAFAK